MGPELRIFAVNGREELAISGRLDSSNLFAACERIDERLKSRGRSLQDASFDLGNQALDPIAVGRIMLCLHDNHVKLRGLKLASNRLADFDVHYAVGAYLDSVYGRFLAEVDLTDNAIGDFGVICLLQTLIRSKTASSERRITVVKLRDNLVSHPGRLIEAIPADLRDIVYAPPFSSGPSERALIHITGLDQQKCPRASRDMPETPKVPITRPLRTAKEPEDNDW